jgi:hypothetical protein
MTEQHQTNQTLEAFFEAGRTAAPQPSGDLMARILADAEAARVFAAAPRAVRRGLWASLMAAIGGWPAVASLATATVAGLYIGVSPPAQLEDFAVTYLGATDYAVSGDFAPGFEDILTEG